MKNIKEIFELYVEYFSNINKKLKLERNGKIKVIDKDSWEVEVYSSWQELENAYNLNLNNSDQKPTEGDQKTSNKTQNSKKTTAKPLDFNKFKYWCFGDSNRWEELSIIMSDLYREIFDVDLNIEVEFRKNDWVYYLDSVGNLCQTNNLMVIDLLKNSSDWTQIILPIKQFTKEDIAKMIGLSIDQFEIV